MNFKTKIINYGIALFFLSLMLAPHSVALGYAQNVSLPAATSSFLFELKDGNDQIFQNDNRVQNLKHVFLNTTNTVLKNTFRADTTYSKSEFTQHFGYDLVYTDYEHIFKSGSLSIAQSQSVNDPGFSSDPNDVDRQWALYKAHFVDAWGKVPNNNNVVIAEVDTGIDATHEDLSAGQIVPGYNFLTNTIISSSDNSDDNGHGTLVAGVMAATPNNFRGIAGASWNSLIMPLKALDATGAGNSANVAAAIVYAADHGAGVINMSLGGVGFGNDTTLSNAIRYAYGKGLVIIAAAGNDVATTGGNLDVNPVFPICNDNGDNNVIGVTATDINDQKATFANYGKSCVDVSAPGKRILSTINSDPVNHTASKNAYAYASGTSLATPFVSAEAAMIKAVYPTSTNLQIRNRILKSADPIDPLNTTSCNGQSCDGLIGVGRINVLKALDSSLVTATVISDGDLVRDTSTGAVYYISGGKKQPVSSFVLSQKFAYTPIKNADSVALNSFPLGSYALPIDGTVIKSAGNPTVYIIVDGIKRPLTYQVFVQRNISQVAVLSDIEVSSWIPGQFMSPVEGTVLKPRSGKALYWVIDGLLHPMNYEFWVNRGLPGRDIMIVPDLDLPSFPIGVPFVR
jgi:subtilisin family serine protease